MPQHKTATDKRSVPSLLTSEHGFNCTSTEPILGDCIEALPDSTPCQHLVVDCAKDGLVTASNPPLSSSEDYSSATNSGDEPTSSHAGSKQVSFPTVVGVLSGLLLVGVFAVVGMVIVVILWRRRRGKSAMVENHLSQAT